MEKLKDMIVKAVSIGAEVKFSVQVNSEETREVSYIELGTFLVTNVDKIERVHINILRD